MEKSLMLIATMGDANVSPIIHSHIDYNIHNIERIN